MSSSTIAQSVESRKCEFSPCNNPATKLIFDTTQDFREPEITVALLRATGGHPICDVHIEPALAALKRHYRDCIPSDQPRCYLHNFEPATHWYPPSIRVRLEDGMVRLSSWVKVCYGCAKLAEKQGYYPVLIPTEENRSAEFIVHHCGDPLYTESCPKPVISKIFFPSAGRFVFACEEHAEKDRKEIYAEQQRLLHPEAKP